MASTPTRPRPRNHHGQLIWRTRWYDDQGERREKHFGKVDEVTAREADKRYRLWLTDWAKFDRVKNPQATPYTYTVAQLAEDYLDYARATFVKNGRHTSHCWTVAYAMQELLDTFGDRPCAEVKAHEVALLRDAMCWRDQAAGIARGIKTVNGRLFAIKAAFLWGMERGTVPEERAATIKLVGRLREGRCAANPSRRVRPVSDEWVELTKKCCPTVLRDMIELQRLTGMRPGEVCDMRVREIDTAGDVWVYRPTSHKTQHFKIERWVFLGPKAQAIVGKYLTRDFDRHLFSAAEAHSERLAARRTGRETPPYPSHLKQRSENPVAGIADRYTEATYRKAVHHACARAFPFMEHLSAKQLMKLAAKQRAEYRAKRLAWINAHKWNPNQIRHAAATTATRKYGSDAAKAMLGHTNIATTELYAEPDFAAARKIAKKAG